MSNAKRRTIEVQGTTISILSREEKDYISLTDMVRNFDGGSALIEQWLKNKDTVLFLGVWERINNPAFNSLEFEGIRNEAGRNSFFLSAKKWSDLTGAKGLIASAGRYGGTYTPIVEAILRSNSRDARHIEHTLDGLLSFCGYEPALQLYKKLCRHYFSINPAATAEYVYAYREMWDSEQKEKQPSLVEKHFQKAVAKAKQLEAKKPRGKKGK